MSYFPFFVDIENADALVIGGGKVALRKVRKLLPYGPHITVAAREFCDELMSMDGIERIHAQFQPEMLENRDFVIAATDDTETNRVISKGCRENGIPVNAVDDRENCTFLFPALVKNGELSIGISTGGASPSAAAYIRRKIEETLPPEMGDVIGFLDALRPVIKAQTNTEAERAKLCKALFARCIELGRAMSEEELAVFDLNRGEEGHG